MLNLKNMTGKTKKMADSELKRECSLGRVSFLCGLLEIQHALVGACGVPKASQEPKQAFQHALVGACGT